MAGQVIVLLGPSGSGKSIQARRLEQRGWKWVSSGELLRHNPVLAEATAGGQLVSSPQVEQVVGVALCRIDLNTNIVLDGFPREPGEQVWLDTLLIKLDRKLTHVIFLRVTPELAAHRLAARMRPDDTLEAQVAKWQEYQQMTMPVIEHYRATGLLVEIDGAEDVVGVGIKIDQLVGL